MIANQQDAALVAAMSRQAIEDAQLIEGAGEGEGVAMPVETKWTPGPWKVAKRKRFDVCSGDFTTLAAVYPLTSPPATRKGEYNAHLIAAAPDLYEALVRVRDVLHTCAEDTIGTPTCDLFRAQVNECNAALAKARGGK